jgi:hypothetical protein
MTLPKPIPVRTADEGSGTEAITHGSVPAIAGWKVFQASAPAETPVYVGVFITRFHPIICGGWLRGFPINRITSGTHDVGVCWGSVSVVGVASRRATVVWESGSEELNVVESILMVHDLMSDVVRVPMTPSVVMVPDTVWPF